MKKSSTKNIKRATLFFLMIVTCSSCSVAMAAKKTGTDITKVQGARTRGQILSTGAEIVSSEKDADGCLTETYKIKKESGSAARAVMHGFLDFYTLGIWEIFGTPIEGSLNKKEYYTIKVLYDKGEAVKRVEI